MRPSTKLSVWISQGIFIVSLPLTYQLTFYLHPIALAMVWFSLTAIVFLLVFGWKREKIILTHRVFITIAIVYSLTLLVLLFFRPSDQSYHQYNVIPFATIWQFLSSTQNLLIASYNLLANIILFTPFGLFFMFYHQLRQLHRLKLYIIPTIVIAFIELSQFITHRGSLDIDDLILNLLGVWLGYRLFPLFLKLVEVKPK